MPININCIYNDKGAWCTNKEIKRSFLGLGARCCVEYPMNAKKCKFKIRFERPKRTCFPPPAPCKKIM